MRARGGTPKQRRLTGAAARGKPAAGAARLLADAGPASPLGRADEAPGEAAEVHEGDEREAEEHQREERGAAVERRRRRRGEAELAAAEHPAGRVAVVAGDELLHEVETRGACGAGGSNGRRSGRKRALFRCSSFGENKASRCWCRERKSTGRGRTVPRLAGQVGADDGRLPFRRVPHGDGEGLSLDVRRMVNPAAPSHSVGGDEVVAREASVRLRRAGARGALPGEGVVEADVGIRLRDARLRRQRLDDREQLRLLEGLQEDQLQGVLVFAGGVDRLLRRREGAPGGREEKKAAGCKNKKKSAPPLAAAAAQPAERANAALLLACAFGPRICDGRPFFTRE